MTDWYSYDPDDGFQHWGSAAEAQRAAEEALEYARDDAGDGWSEVRAICWGRLVVSEQVVETYRLEVPPGVTLDEDGLGSDGIDYSSIPENCDALVDYALRPVEEEALR